LQSLEAFSTEIRWVNPASADRQANIKALQLTAAKDVGLCVPRTLITNDPRSAEAFFYEGASLIYKHIGSAPKPITTTKQFLESDIGRLNSLQNCPAIFQEYIEAQVDIRATIIGDKIFAAEIDSQRGKSPFDWRFDHTVPFR
jgi:glutathione synthase/RimK-type ligase-like ATP-grasp enzyme